ncbi:AAA family ATPase [Rhizobium leguminosarum]|nr:AAA family ATPase [Rhizobium leguminosarum]
MKTTAPQLDTNLDELRGMSPRKTPASDSRQALIFGIYDRLCDHGHCSVDVVLAPADEAGAPDWENTGPANVSSLPDDEWPQDEQAEKRACVIVSVIDGCDPDSSFIVTIHDETGIPGMFQIHGPEIDRVVADSIIGRDLGNRPPPREPTELQKSMAKLRAELFAPPAAVPSAANDNVPVKASPSPPAAPKFNLINAQDLLGLDFPPVKYVIPGYIAEGLTILGGRPKLGKSWLALGGCVAVATGGECLGEECEQGDVLYLALEDNQRRLQDRLETVLSPPQVRPDISRLSLMTEGPRINAGLIELLDQWRLAVEDPRLIVIDTLAMVRPPKGRNQDSYDADYAALSPLQKYAGEHRLAIVVVTHVRKMEASDPLEMISGTNGLTGAADSILVLNRDQDGPKLYGRGRDIEEIEKALKFNAGVWTALGNADDVKQSDQRRRILEVLTDATTALTPTEIAKEAGMKETNVKYLLRVMVKAGSAEKVGYGQYKLQGR